MRLLRDRRAVCGAGRHARGARRLTDLASAAGWIAPAATMVAAMMTAANLGARLTGWGFVVFTVGSIAWTAVGLSSGQTNLVTANAFLTLVNVVGVWRWLGREAKYRDDAARIEQDSRASSAPTLVALSDLAGKPVAGSDGGTIGSVVDAMVACSDGRVAGLLIRHGGVAGVGERVVLLDTGYQITADRIVTRLSPIDLDSLPEAPDAVQGTA